MRFILTSKSWSFAINRAATVAEVVVVAAAAAAVDQAAVAIVTIIAAAEIVITVIWDRVQCIMATMAAAAVVEAATTGTIAEILTCQTYNR